MFSLPDVGHGHFVAPRTKNQISAVVNWLLTSILRVVAQAVVVQRSTVATGGFSLRRSKTEPLGAFLILLLALPAVARAQFTYTDNGNGTATITAYTGPGGTVTIPSTINGLTVTRIESAFYSVTNVTNVTIPSSVTYVGDYAFWYCTSLASVTIASSVTYIGDSAFWGCASLSAITIPRNVATIGYAALANCGSLGEITVSAFNSTFSSLDGVLYNKNHTQLIQYPPAKAGGDYTISDVITAIADFAFYQCANLTNVTFGHGLTSIGAGAFGGCGLVSAAIPANVTSIGSYAFLGCYSLRSVTLPDSLTGMGNQSFGSCASLERIVIPSGVMHLGDFEFSYCTGLKGVYFRGDAPSLGWYAFYMANNATIYYLPATVNWGPTFGGLPTALWRPELYTFSSVGMQTNQFGFSIAWVSGKTVVVEACADLSNPTWVPLQTNTLSSNSSYFSDAQSTNYLARFYRVRWP